MCSIIIIIICMCISVWEEVEGMMWDLWEGGSPGLSMATVHGPPGIYDRDHGLGFHYKINSRQG